MLRQYSSARPLSSENHQASQERSDAPVAAGTRATSPARTASAVGSMTCGRLYSCETLFQRLAQDLQDVTAELRQFIQKENAVVSQGDFAGHRDLPAPDQPRI
jgi:hypothetical protein